MHDNALLIDAIIQSANHVSAMQYIKSSNHRTKACDNGEICNLSDMVVGAK